MMGVYAIRNTVNGRCYFGSTINWNVRRSRHLLELRKGIHHCLHLQRAWNKYGEAAFEFIFIRLVPRDLLQAVEQLYFDLFPDKYNTGTYAGMAFLGRRHTSESRDKMRTASTGRPCHPETRDKLRQANIGKTYSAEVRAKVSAAGKGRRRTEDHAKKYRGVGYWWRQDVGVWEIKLYHNKTRIYSAHCRTDDDAREVVRLVRDAIDSGRPVAIPPYLIIREIAGRKKTRGYCFDSHADRWKAWADYDRKVYLGSFLTELEAAEAVRRAREECYVQCG